jgi:phosphoribosylaminoimidazole carboxylase PurE protein
VTTETPLVGLVYGSPTDKDLVDAAAGVLERFGVPYESLQLSAHRNPEGVSAYAAEARTRGLKVVVAVAGMAAHLAGAVASRTILPVIGVPAQSGSLSGLDALLSTVQMPAGVPVATVAVGSAGARNAALLAVEILALSDSALSGRLEAFKRDQAKKKVL